MNVRVIDPQFALKHGYSRPTNFMFAQKQPMVPVQISEIAALVTTLPLAFAKMPDDRYVLVAVTGWRDGRNLLVDDAGRWGSGYVPNNYRVHPFTLQNAPSEKTDEHRFSICFDHTSGLYREQPDINLGEYPFFDESGNPKEDLQKAAQFLSQNVARQAYTQKAVDAIAQTDLLKLWELPVTAEQDALQLPKGLYIVDETKLPQLSHEEVIKLFQSQSMALIYAQLLSVGRLMVLRDLYKRHSALLQASKRQEMKLDTKDLAQMLGDPQGEILKFDWMK